MILMTSIPQNTAVNTGPEKVDIEEYLRFYRAADDNLRRYFRDTIAMAAHPYKPNEYDELLEASKAIVDTYEKFKSPEDKANPRHIRWMYDLVRKIDRTIAVEIQDHVFSEALGIIRPDDMATGFTLLDEDGIDNLPDFKYMLDGLIAQESLGVVFGAPGSGKSFLMASMAICVADGRPWLGRYVEGGPVVYLAGGEGRPDWKRRIRALKTYYGIDKTQNGFFMAPDAIDLRESGSVKIILNQFEQAGINPSWVIVDTLARHMSGGDDNSSKDMGVIMENCNQLRQEIGGCLTVVHHPTKANEEEERGSGSLRGYVDYSIAVKRYVGTGNILLKSIKDKYAEKFDPIKLRLHTVELDEGPTPVVVEESGPVQPTLTDQQRKFLSALEDFPRSTVGEIIRATNLARGTAYRTKDQLIDMGYVVEDEEKRLTAIMSD